MSILIGIKILWSLLNILWHFKYILQCWLIDLIYHFNRVSFYFSFVFEIDHFIDSLCNEECREVISTFFKVDAIILAGHLKSLTVHNHEHPMREELKRRYTLSVVCKIFVPFIYILSLILPMKISPLLLFLSNYVYIYL